MNNNGSKPGSKPTGDSSGNNDPRKNSGKPISNKADSESFEGLESGYSEIESHKAYDSDSRASRQDRYKKSYDEFEDRVKGTFKNIQDSRFYNYASSNKEQTVSYILLVSGLLLFFIDYSILGGLLLGAVAGYHFAGAIIRYLRNLPKIIEGPDQLRYIVITVLLFALLFAVPSILIGALFAAIFKEFTGYQKEGSRQDISGNGKSNRPAGNNASENKTKR